MENSGESSLFARSRTTPISSVLHLDSPTVPAHHELALRLPYGILSHMGVYFTMWSHPFDSNFSTPGSFTSGRASHGKRDERAV